MEPVADHKNPRPKRFRRRLVAAIGFVLVAVLAMIAALPWLLSTRPGRIWLLGQANKIIAPGSLEAATVEFSWFGPTRLTRVLLRDHQGDPVVSAPRAILDRNLRQLLFERPRLGTLELEHGVLDVDRDANGKINLFETIRPVLGLNPRTDLRIKLTEGRLRFRSAELPEPVEAEPASLDLRIAPFPNPITLLVDLRKDARSAGGREAALQLSGRFDRGKPPAGRIGDIDLSLSGNNWPWKVARDGLEGSGRLNGSLSVRRITGLWTSAGDVGLSDLDVTGSRLAGDHLSAERLVGVWDLAETAAGWSIVKLDVTSPILSLQARGDLTGSNLASKPGEAVAEGKLDLAAVARQLPHALRIKDGVVLERGTAELRLTSNAEEGTPAFEISARVSDLLARDGQKPFTLSDPATLSARFVRQDRGAVQVDRLTAVTPYLNATARGDLAGGLTTLHASVDLGGLQRQLRELVDLGGIELAGRGEVNGQYQARSDTYTGHVETRLNGLKVAGIGPIELDRDEASLTVDLRGPVGRSGLPGGWAELQSRWESGTSRADFAASSADSHATFALHTPLSLGDLRPAAEAKLDARFSPSAVEIESFDVALKPQEDRPDLKPIQATARGRYDRTNGVLTLSPFWPGAPRGAIAVSSEGIKVVGLNDMRQLRAEGGLVGDLAALGSWLPPAYRGLRGTWEARTSARTGETGLEVGGNLAVEGLSMNGKGVQPEPIGAARRADPADGPITLSFQASAPRDASRIDLSEFVLSSHLATVELAGRLDEPKGRRQLTLDGRVLPEWEAISRRLAERVEPGATVRGHAYPLKIRAVLNDGWRETLEGSCGVALDGADVFGLDFGPTTVVVRSKAGKLSVDPIDVVVNQGQVHVEPELKIDTDTGNAVILGPSSRINDVVINDEVSHRVLSFVAPVFDRATRVRGRVSAEVDSAFVPIGGSNGLAADGTVVFQNVEFLPGPFADPLMELIGRKDRPLVRLDEPVKLAIADRRVYQKGLTIPIGRLTKIGIEGWVDFDRHLNLVASVPIVPSGLADKPVIGEIASAAVIRVPIRGTVQDPQVDREAFKIGMKEMGQSVLEKGLTRGVPGLLDLITRPRDPNTPPPPPPLTREEQKARQMDRRAERRRRRGLEP